MEIQSVFYSCVCESVVLYFVKMSDDEQRPVSPLPGFSQVTFGLHVFYGTRPDSHVLPDPDQPQSEPDDNNPHYGDNDVSDDDNASDMHLLSGKGAGEVLSAKS